MRTPPQDLYDLYMQPGIRVDRLTYTIVEQTYRIAYKALEMAGSGELTDPPDIKHWAETLAQCRELLRTMRPA